MKKIEEINGKLFLCETHTIQTTGEKYTTKTEVYKSVLECRENTKLGHNQVLVSVEPEDIDGATYYSAGINFFD